LVANLDQALDRAHFQQSVELSTLTIVAASVKPQTIHSAPPSPSSSTASVTSPPIIQVTVQTHSPAMAARYAPLVLVAPLHAMPQDYQTRLPQYDSTSSINAQQHVDKMNDYFDLQEVDETDVQMRLFAQSLTGEVKKWFKALRPASINDLAAFHRSFLDRWEVKKNPLQILSEYENIKRNQGETVQDYCTRFNNLYNAIPADIKPPQGLALIKFPDGFDTDMSYQLRERNSATLEDMQKSAVSMEANLLARRARQRTERRVTIKEEPSTSSSDAKLDSLARAMERMMERLTITERNPPRDNQVAPPIQNPNFRRNLPQIRQRDPRDQREQRGPDQQIRPPLQENYADDGEEVLEEFDDTHINLMGIHDDESIFLTQEEHEMFLLSQTEVNEEADKTEQEAFENAIMEVHRQYNLRSKKANDNPPKKTVETKKVVETKKTSENPPKKILERNNVEASTPKSPKILQRENQTEVSSIGQTSQPRTSGHRIPTDKPEVQTLSKVSTAFSLEGELAKLKIPIPLSELMNKNAYRSQVIKSLSIEPEIGTKALNVGSANHSDTVNLVDDRPELLFGPEVDGQTDNGVVTPFYISLNIHDLILHNAMLDSGASHNLMKFGLLNKPQLNKVYHSLYNFFLGGRKGKGWKVKSSLDTGVLYISLGGLSLPLHLEFVATFGSHYFP
jgi:hypothetical protein